MRSLHATFLDFNGLQAFTTNPDVGTNSRFPGANNLPPVTFGNPDFVSCSRQARAICKRRKEVNIAGGGTFACGSMADCMRDITATCMHHKGYHGIAWVQDGYMSLPKGPIPPGVYHAVPMIDFGEGVQNIDPNYFPPLFGKTSPNSIRAF
jgi:hypothetical protein